MTWGDLTFYNKENFFQNANLLIIVVLKFLATLSAVAAGTVLGWTSPISTDIEKNTFHGIKVNDTQMGWIGSLTTLGALCMCILTGFICDKIGRRLTLLLLVIPFSIGWSLLIWAKTIEMLYIGRFVCGLAIGGCCIAAPLYTSEIAQKEIRGALGSYFQLMVTIGVLYAYVAGKYLPITDYTMCCALLPLIFFVLFAFQPETPLFYLKKGKFDKAKASLIRLRGKKFNVDAELNDLDSALKDAAFSNVSICYTIKKRATQKAFVISIGLMFFQQLCGVNAIVFYTRDIFQQSGIKIDPQTATIIVGGVQVLATFASTLAIDTLGRKCLLFTSGFVMAISSTLLGVYFTLKDRHVIDGHAINGIGYLPLASVCLYIVVFSLGFGPIPWMISSEIHVTEIKGIASSIAGSLNWFLAFIVTKFYLDLQSAIGADITFYAFATISLISAIFVYFVVPETKGKTIDEIQDLLAE